MHIDEVKVPRTTATSELPKISFKGDAFDGNHPSVDSSTSIYGGTSQKAPYKLGRPLPSVPVHPIPRTSGDSLAIDTTHLPKKVPVGGFGRKPVFRKCHVLKVNLLNFGADCNEDSKDRSPEMPRSLKKDHHVGEDIKSVNELQVPALTESSAIHVDRSLSRSGEKLQGQARKPKPLSGDKSTNQTYVLSHTSLNVVEMMSQKADSSREREKDSFKSAK